ncbi:hypothetical protein MOX02_15760 [Methylobacterium oxalidis]|uniref:Uncharacterized protein n=2 Tax=Methylobacterium oxalidis TaxID=944322 RepID=A0A512J0N7_9HYPH|nr:hypothetical protein MOX02_15760 [Methylobacterium oxalidis]GJE34490.1 hypothetical protein LDDCCGHA_4701 [Methylobacterium oxalidis]GLS66542.1 hypothetical protein GCM10007888_49250 [Methylobacterium oxalidis]
MTIVARAAAPCCAEEERRLSKLEQTLMRAFWQSLGDDPLPPMAALEAAARIVGTLYAQVARAHEGPNACRCGWEPDPDGDLIVLEANLAAALLAPERGPDLARMPAAGRA